MRVTSRGVNIYGFIAVAIMVGMLAYIYFGRVSQIWQWRLFAVALTLFAIRIALRLTLARQKRLNDEAKAKEEAKVSNDGAR
jgi:hypothetical protein